MTFFCKIQYLELIRKLSKRTFTINKIFLNVVFIFFMVYHLQHISKVNNHLIPYCIYIELL